jgi:valyl-tRNA synthetase
MSKTKGNVINPIDIIERFGTDAVRFTLASMASPGTDIAFSEARTEGYRAFANKIWNAARFLFMNIDRAKEAGITMTMRESGIVTELPADTPLETRWIFDRLNAVSTAVDRALADYRFDEAANAIYQFFWGELCDWYLELVKLRLNFAEKVSTEDAEPDLTTAITLASLTGVFEAALRLLSPFMPFLTEEIWHALYNQQPPAKSIALTRYPQPADFPADPVAASAMKTMQDLIVTVRALRKELGVPEKESTPILLHASNRIVALADANQDMLARMARVASVEFASEPLSGSNARSTADFDVAVVYERQIDLAAERERLTKELARLEKILISTERQLNNPAFIAKAPAHIVDGLRKQHAETKILYDKTKSALDALG